VKVSALIGPSGTGKSHRAIMVAHQTDSDIIIDDGLIIKGNRILFGHTAKKQPTRIGAIKAALFLDRDLAARAREALFQNNPAGVIILGTSLRMVERIALTLNLPEISRVIDIKDVATDDEIKNARINRVRFSKHVIPAPTMEVRKSFPGTLIDPLRVFIKKDREKSYAGKSWHEQSVVRPTFTFYGRLTISENALSSIVTHAAKEVAGISNPGKVHVQQTEEGLIINISPVVLLGARLPEVSKKLQLVAQKRIQYMTGLAVKSINVMVKDIDLNINIGTNN